MSPAPPCLDEATFLEVVSGGLSPAHAARVDAHLDACAPCRLLVAQALQPLESSPPRPPAAAVAETLERGTAVGRYLVLEPLGAGGMGVVYAAYDPQLDRRVALKLLRHAALGLDAERGRTHLLREAQAMARISHPHVVPVYDVGTHGAQVFLAMEYVEAQTVRQWLRSASPSWRQARDAFVDAGRGLAAAHDAGLLHGDFKPENLLVGQDGRVRVTDFGLARPSTLVSTGAGERAGAGGTPAYMAPEQLSGRGPVDARSDQFSFCAALYEALYGERPFAGTTLAALSAEVSAGRVRPPPPGTGVPTWLHRVVLRGLEVDPAARYPRLEALLAALRDDPAVRRRRWMGAAAGVGVLVGAVVATDAVQAHRARACASAAEHALAGVWDAERGHAVEAAFLGTALPFAAEAWARVHRSLDAHTSAWVTTRTAACEASQVRDEQPPEVREKRLRCLDRRLAEVAALTRVLMQADADVVGRALRAVEALPSPAGCADAAVWSEPGAPRDAATREHTNTALVSARALSAAGRYAQALRELRPAAEAAHTSGDLTADAEAQLGMSELHEQLGDYAGAERSVFAALFAAEAGHHDEVAARAWILAVRLSGERLEQVELAHRWGERAEAAVTRLGGDDVLRARLKSNLGGVLYVEGRYSEADAHYQQALELLERTVETRHLEVADILLKRGSALVALGRQEEAQALIQRALALREASLGPEHPEVGQALADLSMVRGLRGEATEAERLAARSLEILERVLGPENPGLAPALEALTTARFVQGRDYAALLPQLERVLRLYEASEGPESTHAAVLVNNMASALRHLGRLPEAEKGFREAISRLERKRGPRHPLLVPMNRELAMTLSAQGRFTEALLPLQRAVDLQDAMPEDNYRQWGPLQWELGRLYLRMDRPRDARVPLSRLLEGGNEARVSPQGQVLGRFSLGQALWRSGQERERAVALVREARARLEDLEPQMPKLREEMDTWLAHPLTRDAAGSARAAPRSGRR